MSELLEKLPQLKNEVEKTLHRVIRMYLVEKTPRKRQALDRTIRHVLNACSELYKASLIIQAAYVDELIKEGKKEEGEEKE